MRHILVRIICCFLPKKARYAVRHYYKRKPLLRLEIQRLRKICAAYPRVLSYRETIEKILAGASIARYGDGEYNRCLRSTGRDKYQMPSPRLTRRLRHILKSRQGKLLVCIAAKPPINTTGSPDFYDLWWLRHWKRMMPLLAKDVVYGNANISRTGGFIEVPIATYNKIWNGRDVVFVVPKNGRFTYDDRLFGKIKSKAEVSVPPTNAFAEYDRILSDCLKFPKDRLFFISAGMTATVLAADLAAHGYQALDMGHLTACYHSFLGEAPEPEATPMISK